MAYFGSAAGDFLTIPQCIFKKMVAAEGFENTPRCASSAIPYILYWLVTGCTVPDSTALFWRKRTLPCAQLIPIGICKGL